MEGRISRFSNLVAQRGYDVVSNMKKHECVTMSLNGNCKQGVSLHEDDDVVCLFAVVLGVVRQYAPLPAILGPQAKAVPGL